MSAANSNITAVIPAKNEAPSIGAVIEGCLRHCGAVLVVDGHSTDGTAEVSQRAGARVQLDHRRGKGDAIRTAIPLIESEFVIFMDADGSHDPDDIPRLIEPIQSGQADHVIGSRLIGGSSELHGGFDEFFRLAGSSFITACINTKFRVRLSDSQNGFRAFRTSVLKGLTLKENDITIEQELLLRSLEAGVRVLEVPAHEHRRKNGTSHVHLWKVWPRYAYMLVRDIIF